VGLGPRSVAISGNFAVVVNGDSDNVSIVNLQTGAVVKTLAVGRGPVGVAVDTATGKAYVTNEDDGTVSVIDLNAQTLGTALTLGASIRPEAITVVPGSSLALITVPTAGPNGQVVVLNLTTGTMTTVNANPDNSGGSSDAVFYQSKLYVANQTGGSISIIPLTGSTLGTATTVKVGLGARALAIDTADNLLVVSNEASGTLALVDLSTNTVTAKINAVQTGMDGDDNGNDHSDRNSAANAPVIQSVSPNSGKAGATITVTITGTKLTGVTDVKFVEVTGQGSGNGNKGANDFTVSGIQVNAAGTQLTATVKISSSADSGTRLVKVSSSNGTSNTTMGSANTFTVQ
jgi:YVTN family beta-propeller protein